MNKRQRKKIADRKRRVEDYFSTKRIYKCERYRSYREARLINAYKKRLITQTAFWVGMTPRISSEIENIMEFKNTLFFELLVDTDKKHLELGNE
jgi:hypothetical protein